VRNKQAPNVGRRSCPDPSPSTMRWWTKRVALGIFRAHNKGPTPPFPLRPGPVSLVGDSLVEKKAFPSTLVTRETKRDVFAALYVARTLGRLRQWPRPSAGFVSGQDPRQASSVARTLVRLQPNPLLEHTPHDGVGGNVASILRFDRHNAWTRPCVPYRLRICRILTIEPRSPPAQTERFQASEVCKGRRNISLV
jgi:hypothetical protein